MSRRSADDGRRSCSIARLRERRRRRDAPVRAMSRLLENLLIFGRVLRRAGIDVHPGRLLDVIEALEQVNLGARDEVYYTCRTLLVHRREQIPIFDRAFAAFWRAQSAAAVRDGSRPDRSRASVVEDGGVLAPRGLAAGRLTSVADAGDEEPRPATQDSEENFMGSRLPTRNG